MDVIGGVYDSSDQSLGTLPERWEQYAAENNAGAESNDRADGGASSPVASDSDGIEQLSFRSAVGFKPFKRNQNQGV